MKVGQSNRPADLKQLKNIRFKSVKIPMIAFRATLKKSTFLMFYTEKCVSL